MLLRDKGAKGVMPLKEYGLTQAEPERNESLLQEKAYDYLEEALQELGEQQRQCVILFYLKKNSYQQISEKTGFNLLQVKSYIQNGKRNLKILLEQKQKQSRE